MKYQHPASRIRPLSPRTPPHRPDLLEAQLKARAKAQAIKARAACLQLSNGLDFSEREAATTTPLYQDDSFSDMHSFDRQSAVKHSLKPAQKEELLEIPDRIFEEKFEATHSNLTSEEEFSPQIQSQHEHSSCGSEVVQLSPETAPIYEGSYEYQSLITWFMELAPEQLPHPPFQLKQAHTVVGPLFYAQLRIDIARGPKGARAMTGALQSDLHALKVLVE